MKIVKNDDFLVNNFQSEPVYKVLDENNNVVFVGVTEDECNNFIVDNS